MGSTILFIIGSVGGIIGAIINSPDTIYTGLILVIFGLCALLIEKS